MVESLSITHDNQYLIYSTGALFTGDLTTIDGSTTYGVAKTADLSDACIPFSYAYNDNLTPRHIFVDKIFSYSDNQLNTPNTSYEFTMLGSTIVKTVAGPDLFVIMSGAYHSSNNTLEIFN